MTQLLKKSVRQSKPCSFEPLEQRTMMSGGAPSGFSPHMDAPTGEDLVYAPHSTVRGKTIGEWSADWWKWAFSFSMPDDPISDPTGANANLGQRGPVFFLAGNTGGTTNRTFTVPGNKPILVSLIVGEWSQLELGFDKTPEQIRQAAKEQADLIDSLHLTIDGVVVENLFDYRETSPDFHFTAAPNNPIFVPAGESGVAVADGYFVMLKPLGPGQHVITAGGSLSAYGYAGSVTSNINVTHASPQQNSVAAEDEIFSRPLASLLG